jgi:regulator of protease activity HflC (stomatin/prohibitin superfamily)
MISTDKTIGFVKYGPGPLQEVNLFGGHFKVWPDQLAIIDILWPGRHEVRIYKPGIHTVDKAWFTRQDLRLTILSTAEETTSLSEPFGHTLGLMGKPRLAADVNATVRFRLMDREQELKVAMASLLVREKEALGRLEEYLRQYSRDALRHEIEHTNLRVLQGDQRKVEGQVRQYMVMDGRARNDLAIEIVAVHITSLRLSEPPVVPPPAAPFILYRGPIELAPNCRLVGGEGLSPDLKFELLRDQLALLHGESRPLLGPALHNMSHAAFSDPRAEVIVLSLAHFNLAVEVTASHFFQFEDGTQGEHEITAGVKVIYQLSRARLDAITFDTAQDLRDQLAEQVNEVCRQMLRVAPYSALVANVALSDALRDLLLGKQPFEADLGVRIVNVYVTELRDIPPVTTIHLEPGEQKLLIKARADQLMDPSGKWLQVPSGYVAVLTVNDEPLLLKQGDHQLSAVGPYNPTGEVKLLSLDQFPFEVQHEFSVDVPLPEGLVQLPIRLVATVFYQIALPDAGEVDGIEALERITANEARRKQIIETKTRGIIERASLSEGTALLRKDAMALAAEIKRQLTIPLLGSGLDLVDVMVTQIELPEDLYDMVMARHRQNIITLEALSEERRKLLATVIDAEAQRAWAERIPAVTLPLLMKQDPEGLRQFLANSLAVASTLVDRAGSSTGMAAAIEGMKALLGPSTVPPAAGGISFGNVSRTVDIDAQEAERTVQEIEAAYGATALPRGAAQEGIIVVPPSLPDILYQHIAHVKQQPAVNVIVRGDSITIVVDTADSRVKVLLRDFGDYPECAPQLTRVSVTAGEAEERVGRPSLDSLADWHTGSSLLDVVDEVTRHGLHLLD